MRTIESESGEHKVPSGPLYAVREGAFAHPGNASNVRAAPSFQAGEPAASTTSTIAVNASIRVNTTGDASLTYCLSFFLVLID